MKILYKLGGYFIFTSVVFYFYISNYVAESTEQSIRQWVSQHQEQNNGLLHLDIVSYKRVFFNAEVLMEIHSDDPEIEGVIGGSILRSSIKYGPMIFGKQGFIFANLISTTTFDVEQLNENAKLIVEHLFHEDSPLVANVFVGFSSIPQYDIRVSPIQYNLFGTSVLTGEGVMQGYYFPLASHHVVTYNLGDIAVSSDNEKLLSSGNQFTFVVNNNYVDARIARGRTPKPAVSTLSATNIYKPALISISETLNQYIPDYSRANMKEQAEKTDSQGSANLMDFVDVLKRYAELKNLDDQVGWRLNDVGSTREGQDHLHELFRKLEKKSIAANIFVKERFLDSGNEDPFPLNTKSLF